MMMDTVRVGGLAGMLSSASFVPALALLVTTFREVEAERVLGNFDASPGVLATMLGLIVLSDVLYIGFLMGLYSSVREHAAITSTASFAVGLLALLLGVLFLTLTIAELLGVLQTSWSIGGIDPETVGLGSILLVGPSIFGFGLAMRQSAGFTASFAIASMAIGAFIVVSVLMFLFPLPVIAAYGYPALGGAVLWAQAGKSSSARRHARSTG